MGSEGAVQPRKGSTHVNAAGEPDELTRALESALGAEALLPQDEWVGLNGRRIATVAPPSIEQVSECVRVVADHGGRLLPCGHGSWLDAAATGREPPPDVVIGTRRLDRVLSFEPDDLVARVQAGMALKDLAAVLEARREWWPVDPLGSVATVGATIATASSGPLAAGFGPVRDHVLGLTVVLADGRVIRPGGRGGRVVKNVAGYDLVRLFTGSWGTLGIIVEATLRLSAFPRSDCTAVFFADEPGTLLTLARRLESAPLRPAACEALSPSAAGALGLEADAWQMWVRWLASESAVSSALEYARSAARELGTRWERAEHGERADSRGVPLAGGHASGWHLLREVEERVGAQLTLRWSGRPSKLPEALDLVRAFLGGQTPAALVAPSLGRAWVFVSPAAWSAAPLRVWIDRVSGFRGEAARRGAWLAVERAPEAVSATLDPAGDPGPAVRVLRGLRGAFDPRSTLARARFGWA